MRQGNHYPDPDDLFSETRMSFGEHIEDLRVHLIRAGVGFLIGMVVSLILFGKPVLGWISAPVQRELFKFQDRKAAEGRKELEEALREASKLPPIRFTQAIDIRPLIPALRRELKLPAEKQIDLLAPALHGIEDLLRDQGLLEDEPAYLVEVPVQIGNLEAYVRALQRLKPYYSPPTLNTFSIMEGFLVYFKIGLLTGLVVSSPWVFWQIWMFIAAGLYPHEKRLVHVYLPFSLALFLGGILICQIFVIPKAIEALLWFNEWLGFEPELRLSEWIGFAIMMPLVFGISFQTPLVMMFLNKVGIFDVEVFRSHRRIAWFVMAVFAAVITPTVDAISMLFLWVPMVGLYELGIALCVWQQTQSPHEMEETSSDELIEV